MAENTSFESSKASKLYKSLGKGDFDEVMKAYDEAPTSPTDKRLNLIRTVHNDTILHMAIYMRQPKIAIEIIRRCSDGEKDELLKKANEFGNTALHEAAAAAKESSFLVEELLKKAPKLLSTPNKRGEMPLYTAAYYGHREIYDLLVKNIHPDDLLKHLCSYDGDVVLSTVLHATVNAEFYELAYEIATSESSKELVNMKDKDSKTCLHLLASNPTAFKSGNKWGPVKRFLYYCASSENNVVPLDRNESKSGDGVTGASSNLEASSMEVPYQIQKCCTRCTSTLRQAISSAKTFAWKVQLQIQVCHTRCTSTLRQAISSGASSENNVVPLDRNESKSGDGVTGASSNLEASSMEVPYQIQKCCTRCTSTLRLAISSAKTFAWKVQLQIQVCHTRCTSTLRQAISSANRFVWKILRAWSTMESIYEQKKSHGLALKLARLLIQGDYSWDLMRSEGQQPLMRSGGQQPFADSFDTSVDDDPYGAAEPAAATPPIPLFIATSHGILEIVEEILLFNASVLEYRDESKNQNILHVAIMHRQLQIFDLVKKNKAPNSRLARQIDYNRYTILHQVGNMNFYNGGTQPGPALQLQEELKWFEMVKEIVPRHYPTIRGCTKEESEKPQQNGNSATDKLKVPKSETPKEYFGRTHGQLLKDAQDWLKTTSESCSTVAGLMATVAFAAAFTVPGGNDDKNGQPILIHSPFFLVFVITDALSLASSLTSLIMFLSILTSPFELDDFRASLPRKLVIGFTFLFFSVAVAMLAFASTLMLTIPIKKRLTTTFVYFVAFLPVTMFALLQWPLYRAFLSSVTYLYAVTRSLLPWHLISSAYTKVTKAHTP